MRKVLGALAVVGGFMFAAVALIGGFITKCVWFMICAIER